MGESIAALKEKGWFWSKRINIPFLARVGNRVAAVDNDTVLTSWIGGNLRGLDAAGAGNGEDRGVGARLAAVKA